MKDSFFKFRSWIVVVTAVMLVTCMNSCSNDDDEFVAWDYDPITVNFMFVDEDGNDLIAKDGSLYQSNISVTYLEETYVAKWYSLEEEFENKIQHENQAEPQLDNRSRVYLPILHGLYYRASKNGDLAQLRFGDIEGDIGIAVINLVMPDETRHEVVIKRYVTAKGHNLKVKQTVKFDGEVIESLTDGSPYMEFKIVVK